MGALIRAPSDAPIVLVGLTAWGAVWLACVLAWVTHPPIDNIEQLTWVLKLQWGYHKHPPLPTWLISPWVEILGRHAWVSYALGATLHFFSLALFWDLLRRMFGPAAALLGLLCAVCVAYYSSRLHLYNHNTVMLACSVGAAWALWRAWASPSKPVWWLALGLALGLGLLAKYQAVTTVGAVLGFAVASRRQLDRTRAIGLAAALALAACILLPHLAWAIGSENNPLTYAHESSLGARLGALQRLQGLAGWGVELLLRASGALVMVAGLAWWLGRKAGTMALAHRSSPQTHAGPDGAQHQADARRLLYCWALVPLAFVVAAGLLAGANLRPHWASPIALWLVAAGLAASPLLRNAARAVPAALFATAVVQVLLAVQLADSQRRLATEAPRWGQPMAQRWAGDVAAAARLELGGEIRAVIGPDPVASAFSLAVPERPYPVLDGRLEISPWVPPGVLERCGVLFIVFEPPSPTHRPVANGVPGMVWRTVPPVDSQGCQGSLERP